MYLQRKKLATALFYALGVGGAAALVSPSGLAQQQQPAKVEKVEVTGSIIKRVEAETALPVSVITREELNRAGITTASELMDRFTATAGPVYNISQGTGDSAQPGFSGASLRGLGTSNTLVLLNGRRVANHAFNAGAVDLNSIPLAAVERVEILRDGASSIYGTDAIGGVINFILRKDFQGVDATAYATRVDRGGGNTRKYTVAAGFGDLTRHRFNVFGTFDWEENKAILASQRNFANTAIRPDLGISQTSGNVIPANFSFRDSISGRTIRANTSAATGCRPDLGSFQVSPAGVFDPRRLDCRYDFTSVLDIYPPVERKSWVGRATWQITNNHQLIGEYTFTETKGRFAASETPVNDFTGRGPFVYPENGPFYPREFRLATGEIVRPVGDLTAVAWRAKPAGRRTNESTTETSRALIGAQGTLWNWDYNAAVISTKSKVVDEYVDGWVRESALRAAIRTGQINIFGGASTPEGDRLLAAAKILEVVRRSEFETTAYDIRVNKEVWQMAAGPVALGLGAEYRKEELDDQPQPVLFSGDILGGGGNIPPVSGDRTVKALFAELNIPILRNLEATASVRYDKYSDFGNTTNPKIGLRWTPTSQLLLRATYNTGFRAPTLADLYLPRFNSNTADVHDDPIRCPNSVPIGPFVDAGLECEAQFQNQLGGNRALQPEESKQWTFGIVFEPVTYASFGFDFWGIERENSIGALGDETLFDNFARYNALGRFVRIGRNAQGVCLNEVNLPAGAPRTPANIPCAIDFVVQVQENLGIYKSRGVDFSFVFRTPATALGRSRLNFDATYLDQYEYQREQGGEFVNNLGRHTADNFAISRFRHTTSLTHEYGPWTFVVAMHFVRGYRDSGGARDVGNSERWDVQLGWTGIKNLNIVVGVKNILDRDPPQSAQGQSFQVGYDPRYGDPFGRTLYGRLNYTFK